MILSTQPNEELLKNKQEKTKALSLARHEA